MQSINNIYQEFANTEPVRQVRALLTSRINEYRLKNDSAEEKELVLNQGAIRELKALVKILTPLRSDEERHEWDGGFGS